MTIDASRYSQRVSPGARGTKRSARVLPSLTTSRISSSKTQSHAVHHGGELHGYYEGDNWNSFFMNIHMFQSLKKSCFDQLIYVFIKLEKCLVVVWLSHSELSRLLQIWCSLKSGHLQSQLSSQEANLHFYKKKCPPHYFQWEPIYFMALLHFPWDSYVLLRGEKMGQFEFTYLCWHHLKWVGDLKICKNMPLSLFCF